jgi:hypothetical protein
MSLLLLFRQPAVTPSVSLLYSGFTLDVPANQNFATDYPVGEISVDPNAYAFAAITEADDTVVATAQLPSHVNAVASITEADDTAVSTATLGAVGFVPAAPPGRHIILGALIRLANVPAEARVAFAPGNDVRVAYVPPQTRLATVPPLDGDAMPPATNRRVAA